MAAWARASSRRRNHSDSIASKIGSRSSVTGAGGSGSWANNRSTAVGPGGGAGGSCGAEAEGSSEAAGCGAAGGWNGAEGCGGADGSGPRAGGGGN
jgi:hypothetical protein